MRFDNYIDDTLNEKVSKKEKETALKNDNIFVGAEFEFKLDDPLEGGSDMEEMYDNAKKDFDEYNSAVDTYDDERQDYQDETDKLSNELDETQEKISELEDSIAESEDLITNVEDELEMLDDEEDSSFLDARLEDLQDSLSDDEKELESVEGKVSYMEDDIRYREEDGMYEQVETPYLTKEDYPSYFDYMTDYMGYDEQSLYSEPGEKSDNWPQFDQTDGYDDIESAVEGSGILNSFPFNDYEIGEYGTVNQYKGSSTWAIEDDTTVEDGLEVKSPPMELPDFVPDALEDMFDWIKQIGYTDSDCGFHVHMSCETRNELDPIKLMMFTEEQYIFNLFPSRVNNQYAKSVKDKLKSTGSISKKDMSKLLDVKQAKVRLHTEHFDGINIADLEDRHVEFRYMGGSGYERKYKDVVNTIASYAYWLSLACDPEFKKKEYATKLARVFNKMELFEYWYNIAYINLLLKEKSTVNAISRIKLDAVKEDYKKKASSLSMYKLDKKTLDLLFDNASYTESLRKNIVSTLKKVAHKSSILDILTNYEIRMEVKKNKGK